MERSSSRIRLLSLWTTIALSAGLVLAMPVAAHAMHISRYPAVRGQDYGSSCRFRLSHGTEPADSSKRTTVQALVGLVGAAVFIISCMPIPVPSAGTCSHPCGTGLAAILIGPTLTVVVTSVALLLQALFLAHGGLTTLGADIVSMGLAGAFVGYGVFHFLRRLGVSWLIAAFLAGVLSDWATYTVTSFELASAYTAWPLGNMFKVILIAFCPTQVRLEFWVFVSIRCLSGLSMSKARVAELACK